MSTNCKFSAYWHVDDNTKHSSGKHLQESHNKNLDYFISEVPHDIPNNILMKFEDLPSLKYIKNLRSFCEEREYVYLKFNAKIKSEAFLKLATIWTSKILLFQTVLNHTNADNIIWVDCVRAKNLDAITAKESKDHCTINCYPINEMPNTIFGGMINNILPSKKILAQVIKIPRKIITEFTENYINCLIDIDNSLPIYDEEVVLSIMLEKHSNLFNIINPNE